MQNFIQGWKKVRGFFYEKVEKIRYFRSKKNFFIGLGWISEKPVKVVKKWLDYLLVGIIMDKAKNFCGHSMILWKMAGNLLTNGQIPLPRVL